MYIVSIIFASQLLIAGLSATSLKIHVATWNVDTKQPTDNMDELFGLKTDAEPDLILMGLQDIVKPSMTGMVKKLFTGEKWTGHLEKVLNGKGYTKVKSHTMFGIGSYVYLKQSHDSSLNRHSVKVEEAKTGIMKGIGNKGGLVTSFRLYDKDFTVVTAHFPAHYEQNQKRVSTYNKVLNLTKGLRNDFAFWYGDLNFMIERDDALIRTSVKNNNYLDLLEFDQLKMCQQNGTVFKNWQEMDITFKPTAKYNTTTKDYSTLKRPAWTDRILYKSDSNQVITPEKYIRLEYSDSAHKPVIAEFTIVA